MKQTKSEAMYIKACEVIPGGVNSPVRAFKSVGMSPIFVKEAKGAYLTDVDDNHYIDYICSWGPLILGHSSDVALHDMGVALSKGTTYGLPTEIETTLAKAIVDAVPSMEMVRMVSSGTEATMSAIRLARAYTGKDKIIKFEGCYHGHQDGLLIQAGSGALTGGVPTSAGVPASILEDTLVANFNDIESVRTIIEQFGQHIGAVIVEPIPGNMGLIEQKDHFLHDLRALTKEHGILLIFDEVISGFRIGLGGAGAYYDIEPDLTCLGKIIGGGMPVGAYGGKREIMKMIAPQGSVYQAGTLSGNPIAMHMGLNVLTYLQKNPEVYTTLESLAIQLEQGFTKNLRELAIEDVTVNRIGGMVCQFFAKGPITTYQEVMKSDVKQYAHYFKAMLEQGILLPPAQYECMFLSTAHTPKDIEETVACHYRAMKKVKAIKIVKTV